MGELMTIGAFARRTGLSISALRFYASRGLLVPTLVDEANGYRRYAEDQVADGVLIKDLRLLDMSLGQISDALERDDHDRRRLVGQHLRQLEATVARAHTLARAMGITDSPRSSPMSATMQSLDLAEALGQVLPAAGRDPEMPHLMSVLVQGKQGSVRLVATDRHRLAVRDLVPSQLDHDFVAVVSANRLGQWHTALDEPQEVSLHLADDNLAVNGVDIDLTAPALPVTFPDYEQILTPGDTVTTAQVDREQLLAALDGQPSDREVRLSTAPDVLVIEDMPDTTRIEARCDGAIERVALNAQFVVDAARNAVGAELVIEIEDPLRPVLFRSADDGTFTSWIMPIKLDE